MVTFVRLGDSMSRLLYSVMKVFAIRPHPGTFLEELQRVLVVSLLQQEFCLLEQRLRWENRQLDIGPTQKHSF